ncbi:hypothetical protein BABINDRAFT_172073 [Babjeviella inositovora NRRL Y-12698]|uniref:tRNA (guanine(26)-N(2))-dimethyltransferase n=1 Tax=Babjeviella inositovora NRRL Y-12698 TaxID=984486 RepID=A0A1E3QM94_9ASCO|nr:uncharacterized protein BABINDRAFT_172073 [Babjeviella inositovora NRRL Y-12698]ODQ78770.1 hypothetical protein BABINDRAFT_172073 [Babjeviella inositovora NRRL Y-12698]
MSTNTPLNIDDYTVITEGKAHILTPKEYKVFYNPVQQFNRDLSTAGIRAWSELYVAEQEAKKQEKIKETEEIKEMNVKAEPSTPAPFINILEALSATGLRAIRYGKEIPLVKNVVANDMLDEAVYAINRNIEYNAASNVVANHGDAIKYMSNLPSDKTFHVVDLDPYGTAAPFIDSALNAISNDGLMLVTCTDLGVLAGAGFPEKCFALYGGTTLPKGASHEAALRLVLHMIATTAAKYKKAIEPVLCLSIDFYVRLFIRVRTSPIKVKELASNTMITYHCSGCGANANQRLGKCETNAKGTANKFGWAAGPPVSSHCHNCGFLNHVCGPMWAGPLQNHTFIDKILAINATLDDETYGTRARITGMLTLARQELSDAPFYFDPTKLTSILKTQPIPMKSLVAALGNSGFEVSLTHASSGAIKTNAPWSVVLEVFKQKLAEKLEIADESAKAKLQSSANGSKNITSGMAGYKIMNQDLTQSFSKELKERLGITEQTPFIVDFETPNEVSKRVEKLRKVKIVRFQQNPTKNWGPKAKPQ